MYIFSINIKSEIPDHFSGDFSCSALHVGTNGDLLSLSLSSKLLDLYYLEMQGCAWKHNLENIYQVLAFSVPEEVRGFVLESPVPVSRSYRYERHSPGQISKSLSSILFKTAFLQNYWRHQRISKISMVLMLMLVTKCVHELCDVKKWFIFWCPRMFKWMFVEEQSERSSTGFRGNKQTSFVYIENVRQRSKSNRHDSDPQNSAKLETFSLFVQTTL